MEKEIKLSEIANESGLTTSVLRNRLNKNMEKLEGHAEKTNSGWVVDEYGKSILLGEEPKISYIKPTKAEEETEMVLRKLTNTMELSKKDFEEPVELVEDEHPELNVATTEPEEEVETEEVLVDETPEELFKKLVELKRCELEEIHSNNKQNIEFKNHSLNLIVGAFLFFVIISLRPYLRVVDILRLSIEVSILTIVVQFIFSFLLSLGNKLKDKIVKEIKK